VLEATGKPVEKTDVEVETLKSGTDFIGSGMRYAAGD
jgi:hypothetical protein